MCIDRDGICKSCGREFDDLPEYSICPSDDCPSKGEDAKENRMAYIQWQKIKTGEVKRTKHPISSNTANKLVAWLNKPNSASVYEVMS